ncbi:PREDICTED: probable serine/threonine-protein kinase At1g09600 [Brassica oleracea var. oleracea]|uniref:probable serine/threonine-protein kinase At1g09600 n=1 Tax=Brassica oleracea var. oleracea TaxID=109376 RepID=UPI0006A6A6A5|nr:PREDICTED: probable serine/threonine-protein kinase At1g09600 [Brassica oleracea var. oleracea]
MALKCVPEDVEVIGWRLWSRLLGSQLAKPYGEKGRRIRELTSLVEKRFRFPQDSVELYVEKVANRGLCAIAQAESLRYKLLGGLAVCRLNQPKKVIDVKLRKEEARGNKGSKQNESKQISRKSKVVSASDASAELPASIQKRQGENNQTNMSEKFNPNEDAAMKSVMMRGLNRSPPLSKELMMQWSFVQRESPQLTKFSDSVAARDASDFSIAN